MQGQETETESPKRQRQEQLVRMQKQYRNSAGRRGLSDGHAARVVGVVFVANSAFRGLPSSRDLTARAERHFSSGFNCAQSVLLAFSEGLGLIEPGDEVNSIIPAIAGGFGGGLGRTGRTCGAITGGIMVMGLLARHTRPGDSETKARVAKLTERLLADFENRWGTTDCAYILGMRLNQPEAHDRFVGENLREVRCMPVVGWAVTRVRELVIAEGNRVAPG